MGRNCETVPDHLLNTLQGGEGEEGGGGDKEKITIKNPSLNFDNAVITFTLLRS
jgi:hypothetical protein